MKRYIINAFIVLAIIFGLTIGSYAADTQVFGIPGGHSSSPIWHPYPIYMQEQNVPNLAPNGTFTGAATGWTLGAGWAYSANTAVKNGDGTGTLSTASTVSLVANGIYRLVFTISNLTVPYITTVQVGNLSRSWVLDHNDTYELFFAPTGIGTSKITFSPSNTSRFTIDNISLTKVGNSVADSVAIWTSDEGGTANNAGLHIMTEYNIPYVFGRYSLFGTTIRNSRNLNGLTIDQNTADDEILSFKSTDVYHAGTNAAESDTFGAFSKVAGANGGLAINGYIDNGTAGAGLYLSGSRNASGGTLPVILMNGSELSGGNGSPLDATDILFAISNDANGNMFTLQADGSHMQPASTYHNYGTTIGTSGYGLRDNAGTMEFKNSGGAWVPLFDASGDIVFSGTLSVPGAGDSSERFGAGSLAGGNYSLALGNGANATSTASIAVGANSVTTAANQIVVGSGDSFFASSYTDSFDRIDADDLGVDWTESTGTSTNIQILDNNVRATKQRLAIYDQALGNDQYAKMTFKSLSDNTFHGIGVRISNIGNVITGYGLLVANPSGSMSNLSFYLMEFNSYDLSAGDGGTTITELTAQSLADGDELELRAFGTTISMYKNDALLYEIADSTIASGKAAVIANRASGSTATFDISSFTAGAVTSLAISDVYFGNGVTHPAPTSTTYHATGASGVNASGADLIHASGKGTGNAAFTKYRVQTPNPTTSGSDVQALTDKFAVGNEIELNPLDNGPTPAAPTAALKMFGYNKSVADDGIIYLPAITTNAMGFVVVGDDEERAFFTVNSTGTVTLINSSANITVNADTDGKLCLGTGAAQEPLQVKNRLGAKTVNIMLFHD